MPFETPLQVEAVDASTWRLLGDLVYEGSKGDTIVVPAGDTTDFATVPQFLQSFFPRTGAWTAAAVLHDRLCNELRRDRMLGIEPRISSVDADGIFRLIMKEAGVGPVRRWLAWAAVRWAALFNAARRPGWLKTAHLVLPISLVVVEAAAWLLRLATWVPSWSLPW